jgi:putative oxidoreductase
MKLPAALVRVDSAVIDATRRLSIPSLRIALGVVYVWFGLLKVFGASPVAELVVKTAYFLPPELALVGMGVFETIIGIGLLSGRAMRITLALFFVQIIATFLTVVTRPDLLFQYGNPLQLSVDGEFVLKNLVLIAAGLTIASALPKARANPR